MVSIQILEVDPHPWSMTKRGEMAKRGMVEIGDKVQGGGLSRGRGREVHGTPPQVRTIGVEVSKVEPVGRVKVREGEGEGGRDSEEARTQDRGPRVRAGQGEGGGRYHERQPPSQEALRRSAAERARQVRHWPSLL